MAVRQKTSPAEPNNEELTDDYLKSDDPAIQAEINRFIKAKLEAAEESIRKHGLIEETAEEMLARFKAKARRNGKL